MGRIEARLGAKWLDEERPGWEKKIEEGLLNQTDEYT